MTEAALGAAALGLSGLWLARSVLVATLTIPISLAVVFLVLLSERPNESGLSPASV